MNVKMLAYKVNDIGGIEEGHYVLDFTRRESRIWSGKYTSYAMTNGIAIVIMPTDDPVTYTPNDEKILDVNKLRGNPNFRFKETSKDEPEMPLGVAATEQPVIQEA